MAAEKRLGRGLGSLLQAAQAGGEASGAQAAQGEGGGGSKSAAGEDAAANLIPLDAVYPNRFQPRKHFDEESLAELRDSIRTHGVLQPIAVRRDGQRFELIAGERRWRASREAGLASIPAVVKDEVDDAAMLELALVENVQRSDLDPIERALGFKRMVDELSMTQKVVADRVGLKRASVANHLRLLDLAEPIQRLISRNVLSMGHAKAILGLVDPDERGRLADLIVHRGMSVREAEARVRMLNGAEEVPENEPEPENNSAGSRADRGQESDDGEQDPAWVRPIEARLREALGVRARIRLTNGEAGTMTLEFASHAELDRLLKIVAPQDQL